jgi:hypothetical protein
MQFERKAVCVFRVRNTGYLEQEEYSISALFLSAMPLPTLTRPAPVYFTPKSFKGSLIEVHEPHFRWISNRLFKQAVLFCHIF